MRRLLSILLLLVLGLGPMASALPGSDESSLPACCRRLGAHHCAMALQLMQQMFHGEPGFSAPAHCSSYPTATPATLMPGHALATALTAVPTEHGYSAPFPDGLSVAIAAAPSAHSVRGPPVTAID